MKLRGLVFIPGKVTPIFVENDVAPLLKYMRDKNIYKNQNDESLPNDQPMKDAFTTNLEMSESESAPALALVLQESNGEFTVQAKEAIMEKDGDIEAATWLVEFYEFHSR